METALTRLPVKTKEGGLWQDFRISGIRGSIRAMSSITWLRRMYEVLLGVEERVAQRLTMRGQTSWY